MRHGRGFGFRRAADLQRDHLLSGLPGARGEGFERADVAEALQIQSDGGDSRIIEQRIRNGRGARSAPDFPLR